MTHTIQTSVKKTLEEAVTEVIALGPTVEVCRVTVNRQGPKGGNKTISVTEFVRHTHKVTDKYYGEFAVVDPALSEKLRLQGWFRDDDDYQLLHRDGPFTHVLSGEPYEVVRLKSYDHTLYDADDKPLPVGMQFEYIDGRVSNRDFDLPKLAAHLSEREDITLLEPTLGNKWGDLDPLFWRIPHYNQDEGRTHHLSFVWHPDVRTYRRYKKKVDAVPHHFARYDAAHTIMGNDKFRHPRSQHD